MKTVIMAISILLFWMPQLQASEGKLEESLVNECAQAAKDLVIAVTGLDVGPWSVSLLKAGDGLYSTQLVYRVHRDQLTDYEVTIFQDEEGEGCYLQKLEWVGDL